MLLSTLLRAAFLASCLIPWASLTTTALPMPVPNQTHYASTHESDHHTHAAAGAAKADAHAKPPPKVHTYPVAHSDGHHAGSVLLPKDHARVVSKPELHHHAQVASDHLHKQNPGQSFHVQAHHTQGDAHVMIHAVPSHQLATTQSGPAQHVIHLPGPTHLNV